MHLHNLDKLAFFRISSSTYSNGPSNEISYLVDTTEKISPSYITVEVTCKRFPMEPSRHKMNRRRRDLRVPVSIREATALVTLEPLGTLPALTFSTVMALGTRVRTPPSASFQARRIPIRVH